jgi:hypothetical protein
MATMNQDGFVFIEDDPPQNVIEEDEYIGLNVYEKIQMLLLEYEYFVQNNIKL